MYNKNIYRFAEYLKKHYQYKYIIDINEIIPYAILLNKNYKHSRDSERLIEKLSKSIIISSEHVKLSQILLCVKKIMNYAPVCLLNAPENSWHIEEFKNYLLHLGFNIKHMGLIAPDKLNDQNLVLAIVENNTFFLDDSFKKFKVIAIAAVYNEEDIIFQSLLNLINQEIHVYLIDNWSSDSTYKIIKQFQGNPFFLGAERFPPEGPDKYFNLYKIIKRKEELLPRLNADWFINFDIDEVRESPWPGITLKEGIFHVDRLGFNAINHTELTFFPVDNLYIPGTNFESYFNFCKFIGPHPSNYFHVKTWKNTGHHISLAHTAGHEAIFEGRRVYPYKFLLKHYPIRSQSHGEKKIFTERKLRYHPAEKNRGWHVHYDLYKQGCSFIYRPEDLLFFDKNNFYNNFLLERLMGL